MVKEVVLDERLSSGKLSSRTAMESSARAEILMPWFAIDSDELVFTRSTYILKRSHRVFVKHGFNSLEHMSSIKLGPPRPRTI